MLYRSPSTKSSPCGPEPAHRLHLVAERLANQGQNGFEEVASIAASRRLDGPAADRGGGAEDGKRRDGLGRGRSVNLAEHLNRHELGPLVAGGQHVPDGGHGKRDR